MLHSELKVGMKVKANELSNSQYGYTTKELKCEGVVESIEKAGFTIRITVHAEEGQVGTTYIVGAKYFDKVEEDNKMKIEMKKVQQEIVFEVGDLVISDEGKHALIVKDDDGEDYRAVIFEDSQVTGYTGRLSNIPEELEDFRFGKIVRVIKAKNLMLSEV